MPLLPLLASQVLFVDDDGCRARACEALLERIALWSDAGWCTRMVQMAWPAWRGHSSKWPQPAAIGSSGWIRRLLFIQEGCSRHPPPSFAANDHHRTGGSTRTPPARRATSPPATRRCRRSSPRPTRSGCAGASTRPFRCSPPSLQMRMRMPLPPSVRAGRAWARARRPSTPPSSSRTALTVRTWPSR